VTLRLAGQLDPARAALDTAVTLNPQNAEA
jgi:hypothetical protein